MSIVYAFKGQKNGGNRNQQVAACKHFKPEFCDLENELYSTDFQIADQVIKYAEQWNNFCSNGRKILISRGDIHETDCGTKYLVEPLIRYFTKFTSNTGWIAKEEDIGWHVQCMEAFSHFTYHASSGKKMVCDLQGRFWPDSGRHRFE